MANGRIRRIAAIAGAALFLVSTTALSQDTSVATLAAPTTFADTAVDTDTDDRGFPWGLLGLLGLLGLMKRGGGTTVVSRDTYSTPPVDNRPRNVGTGAAADDRTMNLNPRPGGTTDPDRR